MRGELPDDGKIPRVQIQHHRIQKLLGRHGGFPACAQPFKYDAFPGRLGMHQNQAFRRFKQGELLAECSQIGKSGGGIPF